MALLVTLHPTAVSCRLCISPRFQTHTSTASTLLLLDRISSSPSAMKKLRGFRLGRRLVRLWRCLRRPRSKHMAYLRPTTEPSLSPSGTPQRCCQHHDHDKERTEITDVIIHWGRCLARRFRLSSRVRFGSAWGGDNCLRRRLQGDEGSLSLLSPNHLLASQYENEELKVHGRRGKQQQEAAAAAAAWPKPPPKGHLVVYVGRKDGGPLYRAVLPVIYFNHPLFGELLREAEDEFGFHHPGGITIPCPISDFEDVRTRVAAAAGVSCRHRSTLAGCPGGK